MEEQCYKIFKKCFPEYTLDLNSFKKLTSSKNIKRLYRFVDEKLVGFLYYNKNRIVCLCVSPDYQQKGYGSSLLQEAEKNIQADGFKDIHLGRSRLFLASVCTKEEYYERKGSHFFKRRGYTSLGYCEDMCMELESFDPKATKYYHDIDGIEFKKYDGEYEDLINSVKEVDKDWPECFEDASNAFVACLNGKVVSFCNISFDDTTKLTNDSTRVGNIGCVGTIPSMRKKGIGLTLVCRAIEILKEEGINVCNIHYTTVAPWYRKLGFETYTYYWFAHKKIGTN